MPQANPKPQVNLSQTATPNKERVQPWKSFLSADVYGKGDTEDQKAGSQGMNSLVRLKVEADHKTLGG